MATKKKRKVGRPPKRKYTRKPKPIVYPTMPLREWHRDEIRKILIKLGYSRTDAARITETTFKNEFLVLISCANGVDLYTVNEEKLHGMTKEEYDFLIAKQNATKQPKQPHHYLVEYLAQWDDGSYSVEEEVIAMTGYYFMGKDGRNHNTKAHTVKILEQID